MALRRSFSFSWNKKDKNKEKPPDKKPPEPVPDKFSEIASKMIEKELELEKKCEPSTIHDLIMLYSEAVEYFCQKNDPKYLDYQSRMHTMLKKPEVMKALQKENMPKVKAGNSLPKSGKVPESIEIVPEKNELKSVIPEPESVPPISETNSLLESVEQAIDHQLPSKETYLLSEVNQTDPPNQVPEMGLKSQENDPPHQPRVIRRPSRNLISTNPIKPGLDFSPISPLIFHSKSASEIPSSPVSPLPRNLKILVDRHSKSNKTLANRAAADFKSQESGLERRVASRKKIQLTRSMSFSYCPPDLIESFDNELNETTNNDKFECFVVDEHPDEHCDKYEKMLEDIMEKNFGERALKIAEVKLKYESQINEISGMGDIMQMLVQQMKNNMQEEIEKIIEEYDTKRKEQIAKIKEYN